MPNQIIWEDKGVVSRFDGVFSPDIHLKAINELFSDSRIDDVKYIIGDFSPVERCLLDKSDVDYPVALTTGAASYLKGIRLALVAVDKELLELCRHYIELSSDINKTWDMKIFDDYTEAREWATQQRKVY